MAAAKKRLWSIYEALNPLRTYAQTVAALSSGGRLRILDVGCGFDTKTLAHLTGFRVGIDLVTSFNPAAGVHVIRATGEGLPFAAQSFDVVCCRSVLEHVETPELVFAEVSRVLRPGGRFVFVTPNKWDYISLLSAAVPNAWHPKVVHLLTGREEHKTFPTVYRANTLAALRRLAGDNGLGVDTLQLCRQHPHYLRRNAVLYSLGVLFELCVQKPLPVTRPMIVGTLRRL